VPPDDPDAVPTLTRARTAQHHEKEVLKSDSDGRDVVLDDFDWTEAEEKAIRHKIDWHCVPLVTWLYMLCVCRPPVLTPRHLAPPCCRLPLVCVEKRTDGLLPTDT